MKTYFQFLATAWCLNCVSFTQGHDPSAQSPPTKPLITKETQEAIDGGLAFLAKQQAEDGSWGTRQYKGSVGVTSISGLAYLSAGHRPSKGPHGEVIGKALDFVLKCSVKKHWRLPEGFFLQPGGNFTGAMYNHSYAVQFLAEAHAVVDGKKKDEVKTALERGVKIILAAQNKDGGWRYMPEPKDADLSVTASVVHALVAARKAGIEVPQEVLDKASRYICSCHDAKEGNFRYLPGWGKSNSPFALCGAAVSALAMSKAEKGEQYAKGLAYLRTQPGKYLLGTASHGPYFCYSAYYATLAMQHDAGKDWETWYAIVRDGLLNPVHKRAGDGSWPEPLCKHLNTALAVLALQMPASKLAGSKQ